MAIIECVPNISEGRDKAVIDAVAAEVRSVNGVTLVSVESDKDHNRSVLTFAGAPEPVLEAAWRVYAKATKLIDLTKHKGEHPRMGAVDVCPFIPVRNTSMDECAELARRLGKRVGKELNVPVYLYESAASRPERKNLADIRKGEFEGLRDLIGKDDARVPDFGPNSIHPSAGCTAIGARFFLVAFNVNLATEDVKIAKEIAKAIREKDGGMPGVKAMGFMLDAEKLAQVSMNLVDYRKTSPAQAYARIEELARAKGVSIKESEIVGVIPQDAMNASAAQALKVKNYDDKLVLENHLGSGSYLAGVSEFLDDLASAKPTPGGGAAAAVLGAIGCALTEMVANLTIGRKKYAAVEGEARSILDTADDLRLELMRCYTRDIEVFDAVSAAFKLPKETPEQQKARDAAIEEALKAATLVPLACARVALQGLDLAKAIAEIGNTNAISDAGVAAFALHAAVNSATLNMRINLKSIKDIYFVPEHQSIAGDIERQAREVVEATKALVLAKI